MKNSARKRADFAFARTGFGKPFESRKIYRKKHGKSLCFPHFSDMSIFIQNYMLS